jgi:hypothetical protein
VGDRLGVMQETDLTRRREDAKEKRDSSPG